MLLVSERTSRLPACSPLSGQGVSEAHDQRDVNRIESKDARPNEDKLAAGNTNTQLEETSNSIPSHKFWSMHDFVYDYRADPLAAEVKCNSVIVIL